MQCNWRSPWEFRTHYVLMILEFHQLDHWSFSLSFGYCRFWLFIRYGLVFIVEFFGIPKRIYLSQSVYLFHCYIVVLFNYIYKGHIIRHNHNELEMMLKKMVSWIEVLSRNLPRRSEWNHRELLNIRYLDWCLNLGSPKRDHTSEC